MNVAHRALLPCLLALSLNGFCSARKPAPAPAAKQVDVALAYFIYPLPPMHSAKMDKVIAAAQIMYPQKTNVSFTQIDDRRILVAHPTTIDELTLKTSLNMIASSPDSYPKPPESFVAHLLYNRDAKEIAGALADTFPGISAKDLGDDTILLSSVLEDSSNQEQTKRQETEIEEAKRFIALADFPRQSVAVTAWNLRISASDEHDAQGRQAKESIETQAKIIGNLTSTHNLVVQAAITRGWQYLAGQIRKPNPCGAEDNFLDNDFYHYLAAPVARTNANCVNTGGLGYEGLFNPLPPDLTQMLLAVISAKQPKQTADAVIDWMEMPLDTIVGKEINPVSGQKQEKKLNQDRFAKAYALAPTTQGAVKQNPAQVCEDADYEAYRQDKQVSYLKLNCVRQTLEALLDGPKPGQASLQGELRRLVADFLFQYKASVLAPHWMSPYKLTAAAHNLDAALAPIMDAFTRDIEVFQTKLQQEIVGHNNPVDRHLSFSAGSIVTIRTLSDNEAKVSMQTQNFFDATNPPTLKDFADALATVAQNQPKILTGNLSADAVTGALAALSVASQPKATAKLGDGIDLTVTPHSLYGASGMELNLELKADETTDASGGTTTTGIVKAGSSTTDPELTSRVAKHDVKTLVRIDSLKLTELSTVASELVRAKRPLPVILPFLEFPVIGGLVQIPRAPSHVFHRSFAIVSAMEVPTAADLASTIPFHRDELTLEGDEAEDDWKRRVQAHEKMLNRFAYSDTAPTGCPDPSSLCCSKDKKPSQDKKP